MKTHRAKSTRKSPHQDNENLSIHDTPAEFLRVKDLIKFLTLSQSTIWRKVRDGSFPKPVKLSEAVTAWRTADILAWMQKIEGNAALDTAGASS